MNHEDKTQRPGGAGRTVEETWDRLRREDPETPSEGKYDPSPIEDDLYDDGEEDEIMDDPVEDIGSDRSGRPAWDFDRY